MTCWIVAAAFLVVPPLAAAAQASKPQQPEVEGRLVAAARTNPKSLEAQYALATYYLKRGHLKSALPLLQRAQVIDPNHYPSGYDLAVTLTELGKLEEARSQIRRMIAAKETGELHNLLADVEARAGQHQTAAEEYQRAAHMDPSEENLFDWGNHLLQLRAYGPAEEVFTASIKHHPKSARLHVGLGIAQYSQAEYSAAVLSFCDAADLAPKDPRPIQFLGEVYGVAPELAQEVTTRLARFVKTQPRNGAAHLYYALSLWKGARGGSSQVDLRQVETLLRRATALDPTLSKAFLELGILLADQQRHKEAIVALQRAVALAPDAAQTHYRLAQSYQRTGQRELAAKELAIFQRLKDRDNSAGR